MWHTPKNVGVTGRTVSRKGVASCVTCCAVRLLIQSLFILYSPIGMRARGKSNDWIEERRKDVRPNCRVKDIKWACDDPDEYSFTVQGQVQGQDQPPALEEGEEAAGDAPPPPPLVTHTVASYFYENYGIRLRYPKMPLIKTGRVKTRNGFVDEWFPIEFISQEFGKTRDADNQKLTAALRYNDERTGRQSVDRITEMVLIANRLEKNGLTLSDFLGRFGMQIDVEPEAFEGKVESEPKLYFSKDSPAQVNNGDWRLADQRRVAQVFARPAKFYSFAFVSMADERTTERYFAQLFKRLDAHGLENESGVPVFDGDSPSRALRTLIKYSGDRDRNEVCWNKRIIAFLLSSASNLKACTKSDAFALTRIYFSLVYLILIAGSRRSNSCNPACKAILSLRCREILQPS